MCPGNTLLFPDPICKIIANKIDSSLIEGDFSVEGSEDDDEVIDIDENDFMPDEVADENDTEEKEAETEA